MPTRTRGMVVAGLGAASVAPLWALPPQTAASVAALLHAAALTAALCFMVRAARSADAAMRRTRRFLAAALLASAAGALLGLGYVALTGSIPIPSVVDVVTLAWVPLAAYGFWLAPTHEGSGKGTTRLLADGAVAASSLFFASWLAVLQPLAAADRWSPLGLAVQLAYPTVDVFVAAMVLSLLPRARADLRGFLDLVAAGLLLIALSDSGTAVRLAQHGESTFGWPDLTLQAGMCLLALAALAPARPVFAPRPVASALDRNLPYAPVAVAVAAGLWHVAAVGPIRLAAALLCSLMIATIVVRQIVYTRELVVTAQEHHSAAIHDGLTGLANRPAFFARLGEHLATPGSGPAAVLLVDLDGFKEVNDTLGHSAGDEVLIAFARRLHGAAPGSLVARLGGDEFAVLVTGPAAEAAGSRVAADLVRSPGAAQAGPDDSRERIACSVGVAPRRPGDSPADLIRRADLAMYSAKRSRGTRVAVFSDDLADAADRRHRLVAALPGAISRNEMRLVYQPLYRLGDGELAGAEVLLRWASPLLGVVPPDEFIPLAEDSGYIRSIGLWVLEQSVGQMARWEQAGLHLPRLFVNVAAAQFTAELPAQVAGVLSVHGLSAGRLTLEITESQLPGLGVNRPMQLLRESGVHIALDDFGTGYSSLAQLARLPVDILKLDRDFIQDLDTRAGRPVMDAIVAMARALGLTTVAEGIEDLGQAAEASNAGVDIAQGYLFSRPLSPADLALRLPAGAVPPPRRPADAGTVPSARSSIAAADTPGAARRTPRGRPVPPRTGRRLRD